jgi:serine/threonine-protein kinase
VVAGIVLVLGLGGTLAALTWYNSYGPGATVDAPTVEGLTRDEAVAAVEDIGLRAQVGQDWSDTVDPDVVISADPAAGTELEAGDVVALVVSQGMRHEPIPDGLPGLSPDDASQALTNAGFDGNIQIEPTYDEEVAEGLVISVDPPAGQVVPHNAQIKLVVSKGREPIKVPNLVGKTQKQAERAVEKAKLSFTVGGEEFSDEVPRGEVISQFPQPGRELFGGDEVSVTVSKGRQPIEVPDVTDMPTAEALQVLERAGFQVKIEALVPDEVTLNRVAKSSPPGGGTAYLGDTIIISVV